MSPQTSGVADRAFVAFVAWLLTNAANKGWITTSDIAVLAPALALLPAYLIGWWKNRPQNIAADLTQVTADKVPGSPVQGVITTNTMAGRALAQSIPEASIQSAGTIDAANLSKSVQPAKAA
jgi:hypothetical protein